MNWKAALEARPITTPDGKTLRTLADARAYLLEMPGTDATLQAAGQLLKAAEHGGPFLMLGLQRNLRGRRHPPAATAGNGEEAGPLEGAEEAAISNDNQLQAWPPGSRPQDPSFNGTGLTFETLDHGSDYPDMMPQAIRVTDPEGNSCEYWAVHPRRGAAVAW